MRDEEKHEKSLIKRKTEMLCSFVEHVAESFGDDFEICFQRVQLSVSCGIDLADPVRVDI
jgi:hypothetical protein